MGRAWCGWVCPTGGMQEACFRARDRRVAGGRWKWLKFVIWAPWLLNLVLALARLGPKRVDPLFMTTSGLSAASLPGMIAYVLVMGLLIILPALAVGRRAFCHYVCWMAPFMIVGCALRRLVRVPVLHMKPDGAKCSGCGTCTRVCPMSLDVRPMVRAGADSLRRVHQLRRLRRQLPRAGHQIRVRAGVATCEVGTGSGIVDIRRLGPIIIYWFQHQEDT